jgi:hypothetical protein
MSSKAATAPAAAAALWATRCAERCLFMTEDGEERSAAAAGPATTPDTHTYLYAAVFRAHHVASHARGRSISFARDASVENPNWHMQTAAPVLSFLVVLQRLRAQRTPSPTPVPLWWAARVHATRRNAAALPAWRCCACCAARARLPLCRGARGRASCPQARACATPTRTHQPYRSLTHRFHDRRARCAPGGGGAARRGRLRQRAVRAGGACGVQRGGRRRALRTLCVQWRRCAHAPGLRY